MDTFYLKAPSSQKPSELHLTGVTAMWIATKYEEVYPLRLKTLEQKIAHGKLTKADMKKKESEIMHVLGFQLEDMSVLERVRLVASLVEVHSHLQPADI